VVIVGAASSSVIFPAGVLQTNTTGGQVVADWLWELIYDKNVCGTADMWSTQIVVREVYLIF
jgi:hypothetical protein